MKSDIETGLESWTRTRMKPKMGTRIEGMMWEFVCIKIRVDWTEYGLWNLNLAYVRNNHPDTKLKTVDTFLDPRNPLEVIGLQVIVNC